MRSFTRYLKNVVMIIVISGLLLFPIKASASGSIAYEQLPGHFGGFFSDGSALIVADEFQLDTPALIYSIIWWGGYQSPGIVPTADNFKIGIFADSGGHPGTLLRVFPVGNAASRTLTGDWVNPPAPEFDGRKEFQYSFDFPTAFVANSGVRYWLVIINQPSSDNWVWEVSGSLAHLGVQRRFEGGAWTPYFDNTAFRLKGTTPNGGPLP